MIFIRNIVLGAVIFCAVSWPAAAQNKDTLLQGENMPRPPVIQPRDHRSNAAFHVMAMTAIRNRPAGFEFDIFRVYYTRTDQYDPIGQAARKKIVALAYAIQNDPDPVKRKQAFDEYGTMVTAHLANIDVVAQALVLAREDKMFGDPKFFEWMRRGLLRSIVSSGTGQSLTHAYEAMTLGEEGALFGALGVKVLKTEAARESEVYYNMHQVKDRKSKEPYWVFVDVSKPLRYLAQKKFTDSQPLDIGKQ